jgi:cytochrome P450
MDDPFGFYRAIRAQGSVYLEAESGIYFVGSYDLTEAVLRNPTLFSSSIDRASMRVGGVSQRAIEIKSQGYPPARTMSQNDDTDTHDAYRSLVSEHFLPRNLAPMESFVRERTAELLAPIAAKGLCEFVSEFSVPLPIAVIKRHLGFDDIDDATVKRWSDAFADDIGLLASDERAIEVAGYAVEAQKYMIDICDRRRVSPRDDIASVVANARLPDGRGLDRSETISMLTQMLVAGNETTTNALSAGIRRLAKEPETLVSLKNDPRLIPQFVEENLRLESPVQGQFRRALVDTELGGVAIPKGALLHVRLGSANRDEKVFGDYADRLRLGERPPKPHLAFGMGMHFCLGAMLSRLEMRIAFTEIVQRFATIELNVPDGDIHHHTHFHLRGLKALPLRFT